MEPFLAALVVLPFKHSVEAMRVFCPLWIFQSPVRCSNNVGRQRNPLLEVGCVFDHMLLVRFASNQKTKTVPCDALNDRDDWGRVYGQGERLAPCAEGIDGGKRDCLGAGCCGLARDHAGD